MNAKCKCVHCFQTIEFPEEMCGQNVKCPSCDNHTRLYIGDAPAIAQVPYTIVEKPAKERVAAHLAFIRSNSSYRFLRGAIDVCTALAIVGLIVYTGLFFTAETPEAFQTTLIIASFCLAIIVLIAWRQAAFLLIDIADTLLHEHSKSK